MDYLKIYNSLCNLGKNDRVLEYFESHHILPRCLGGSDCIDNLTKLTYREHYVAHRLLTKIYPKESKIHYAFLCMLRDPHGHRILTSRMVDTIKKNHSEFKRWHAKMNNPMHNDSARKKLSDRMKQNNPNKGGAWNHTSYPVKVYFEDGKIIEYEYMKLAATKLNVPYCSMKVAHRKNIPMKKYNILKIERVG